VNAIFAVSFIILFSRSYALRETVVQLLENNFPEYLAVMLSDCVGRQDCQQIFVSPGHFFNFGKSQNRSGLIQVNKVDGVFLLCIYFS
jgi:hypothetical protein